MTTGRRSKRDLTDLTDLFNETPEASAQEQTTSQRAEENVVDEDGFVYLPFSDPFGVLERLTRGRIKDPVREMALGILERVRSDLDSPGNQP